MAYTFNLQNVGEKYEVQIDSAAKYGYFEHNTTGSGGGLWFDSENRLMDYDGVSELPKAVIKAIRACGFVVPRDFE